MYLGVTLIQMGLGVLLDNLWISMLAPLALGLVHFIAVRPEEAYLAEKFGGSYLHYKASVRRYLYRTVRDQSVPGPLHPDRSNWSLGIND